MRYSLWQGFIKSVKYGLIFLIAGLLVGLRPEWKELTVGALLTLIYNYLKLKWAGTRLGTKIRLP